MKFIEWLRIDELTSMSQIDSSGVELLKSGNSYVYFFADPSGVEGRGGRPFEVIIQEKWEHPSYWRFWRRRHGSIWQASGCDQEIDGNRGCGRS